jgi:threonine/homoserine efflux transporter RhtA
MLARTLRPIAKYNDVPPRSVRPPALGVALGVIFLGETLTSTAWIGLGCVVIGVAAMTIPVRKMVAVNG